MHRKLRIAIPAMSLSLISWLCLANQVNEALVIARVQSADIHFNEGDEGSRESYSGTVKLRVAKVLLARQQVVEERFVRTGDGFDVVLEFSGDEIPRWLIDDVTVDRIFLLQPVPQTREFRVAGAFDKTKENLGKLGFSEDGSR